MCASEPLLPFDAARYYFQMDAESPYRGLQNESTHASSVQFNVFDVGLFEYTELSYLHRVRITI